MLIACVPLMLAAVLLRLLNYCTTKASCSTFSSKCFKQSLNNINCWKKKPFTECHTVLTLRSNYFQHPILFQLYRTIIFSNNYKHNIKGPDSKVPRYIGTYDFRQPFLIPPAASVVLQYPILLGGWQVLSTFTYNKGLLGFS